ncbi:MAG: hypothetical protein K6E99_03910 [Bacilli bacterium]|nr:hypothetical protein [Bacilli bacterium]
MNQDINNENLVQNQVDNTIYQNTNVVPQTEPVKEQVQAPVQQEVMAPTPIEQTEVIQEEVSKTEEPKKSKIIVLDEDPVKFEVQQVEVANVDVPTEQPQEEKKEELPQVQTGNIQF